MDMVQNARSPSDLNYVYSLTLTILQYGANPNMTVNGGSGKRRYSSNHSRAGDIFMMKSSHQVLFHYCHILINKDKLLWDPDQTYTRRTGVKAAEERIG